MLHWIFDPAARGFIIAYDLGGNQVLIHNFDVRNDANLLEADSLACSPLARLVHPREVLEYRQDRHWGRRTCPIQFESPMDSSKTGRQRILQRSCCPCWGFRS